MKNFQIILFIVGVFGILGLTALIFPEDGIDLTLRFPSIQDIVSPQSKENIDDSLSLIEQDFKADFIISNEMTENIDSLACIDTLHFYQNFDTTSVARFYFPDNNTYLLDTFFIKLERAKKDKKLLHILHYGDSQIEQDRITGAIRQQLQEKFGGEGCGLLPIVPPFQTTPVGQIVSDSLPRYIVSGTLKMRANHNRYGVVAQVAELNGKVTLSYNVHDWQQVFENTKTFSQITLLVGNTNGFQAKLSAKGIDSTIHIEETKEKLSVLRWKLPHAVSSCSLHLQGKAELYGISLESTSGVTVDNIPLRGSAGTFFTNISSSLLQESFDALSVPLIILEFGGNAIPSITNDEAVEKYKKNFTRQLTYLKKICPSADFILIGPSDMSTKINGELQTRPYVEEVNNALRDVALENGVIFWDMYAVMGGQNSMIQWVDHKPAWANTDYIHFTNRGANRISEIFNQTLLHYYDYYCFRQRNAIWLEE